MIDNKNDRGRVTEIEVGKLIVDENYQREINKAHINEIIQNFDWRRVNVIKVSYRDGKYFVFDGQHTVVAIRTKYGDHEKVNCQVYDGLDWVQEAKLFVTQDDGVSKVSSSEKFRANYRSGDENTNDIVSICEKYGIQITKSNSTRGTFKTSAVNTLTKFYDILDREQFEESIAIVSQVWNGAYDSMTRKVLSATFLFVETYYGQYKRNSLIKRWRSKTIVEIINAGKASVHYGKTKYARVLLDLYNSKEEPANRLPDKFKQ